MTKHRPTTTPAPEWWKHLRPFNKRLFWSRDRQAGKVAIHNEGAEAVTDLIDQLAGRLYRSYWFPTVMLTGGEMASWEGQPEAEKQAWRSAAAETVLQMEWARSKCVVSKDSFDAGNSWLENKPLTIAPDDWQP